MKNISIGLFLTACGTTTDKDTPDVEETLDLDASVVEVFRVPERPWDIAQHPDGRIFCSSQAGSKLYTWDPSTETRVELLGNFTDIQALSFDNETLFFTTTDYGVTGSLSTWNGAESTVLHTQADDGTLFRWPVDLLPSPDSGWIIADLEAPGLFIVSSTDTVSFISAGSTTPEALAFQSPYLYIGGSDGVFRMEWPDGEPEQIDDRPARSLEIVQEEVWAGNSEQGIYIVNGPSVGLTQAARAGSLLWTGQGLYFSDKVGESIWMATW